MKSSEFKILYEMLQELHVKIDRVAKSAPEEVLLDSYDMQKLLKCSGRTLQRLRNEGTIPCNKVGRRYYYPKSMFTTEFLTSIIKDEDPSKRFDD
jgi:hypothetical protein